MDLELEEAFAPKNSIVKCDLNSIPSLSLSNASVPNPIPSAPECTCASALQSEISSTQ
jgi:hypothetical protein